MESSSLNGETARESGAVIGSSAHRHVARLEISYDGKDDWTVVVTHPVRLWRSYALPGRA